MLLPLLVTATSTARGTSQTTLKPDAGAMMSVSCAPAAQISRPIFSSPSATSPASLDFLRGIQYEHRGDYDAAEQQFQSAWIKAPQDGKYTKTLALFYISRKRFENAQRVVDRYKRICGSNALTYSLEAELLFQQHNYDGAYRNARASMRLSPPDPRMHEILGLILAIHGRYLAALPQLQIAAQQNPTDPQTKYFYGRVLYSTGRYPEALREFLACLRLHPGYPHALANLGLCYEALQEFDKAADAYKEAIKLEEGKPRAADVEPFAYYGALLSKLGQNTAALMMLERALATDPSYFRANYELGKLLLRQGNLKGAAKYLGKALTLDPTFAQTYYLVGRLYEKEHRSQDAARYFAVFQRLNTIPANREFPFPTR